MGHCRKLAVGPAWPALAFGRNKRQMRGLQAWLAG